MHRRLKSKKNRDCKLNRCFSSSLTFSNNFHCMLLYFFCYKLITVRMTDCRLQWSSHKRSDCGMRPRLKSHCRYWAVGFIMTTTAVCTNGHGLCTLNAVPFYRPHSRGDNTFGSVRVCVRVCVCPFVCGHSSV